MPFRGQAIFPQMSEGITKPPGRPVSNLLMRLTWRPGGLGRVSILAGEIFAASGQPRPSCLQLRRFRKRHGSDKLDGRGSGPSVPPKHEGFIFGRISRSFGCVIGSISANFKRTSGILEFVLGSFQRRCGS